MDSAHATQTALQFGTALIALIPGIDVFAAGAVLGAGALYGLVEGGTVSNFEDAGADEALWANVTCAVYGAIKDDGEVTAANFDSVIGAIGSVSYAHADVITALGLYASGIGVDAMRQMQITGSLNVGDCSACGGWCRTWDFTGSNGEWFPTGGSSGNGAWSAVGGGGWYANGASGTFEVLDFQVTTGGGNTNTSIRLQGDVGGTATDQWMRQIQYNTDGSVVDMPLTAFTETTVDLTGLDVNMLRVILYSNGTSAGTVIHQVTIEGTGTEPEWNGSTAC